MSTTVIEQGHMELTYEGSVKRVWRKSGNDSLFFEFTDDYSVFDWGKMPDTIENKGRSLAILGAFFFEKLGDPLFWQTLKNHSGLKNIKQEWLDKRFENELYKQVLCNQGARHHFRRLISKSSKSGESLQLSDAVSPSQVPLLEIAGAQVVPPEGGIVCGQSVCYYPPSTKSRRLIPLEVIFRFGMPSGSSLQGRLEKNPGYAEVLGLPHVPKPNEMFPYPVIEFFTKLESSDRLLNIQEALLISQITVEQFNCVVELTRDLAVGLYAIFADGGIELWDGKFEFILEDDTVTLADSIGPDELRLLYKGKHLSKEMLRQVYRGGAWEEATKKAKQQSAGGGGDWKQICKEQLKQEPRHLPDNIKQYIGSLYPMLVNVITGKKLFAEQPDLDHFIESMPSLEVKL